MHSFGQNTGTTKVKFYHYKLNKISTIKEDIIKAKQIVTEQIQDNKKLPTKNNQYFVKIECTLLLQIEDYEKVPTKKITTFFAEVHCILLLQIEDTLCATIALSKLP